MRYFSTKFSALFTEKGNKILDIPARSVLETDDVSGELSEVLFKTRTKDYVGLFYSEYLEPLNFIYPENIVPSQFQTAYPYDARQYIVWKNNVQYNLCGEFCVAYILGKSIDDLLKDWEAKPASLFSRVFKNGKSLPTGISDLMDMVSVYRGEYDGIGRLRDPYGKYILLSPLRLKRHLKEWKLILGCKISSVTGELQASGIPHWITVTDVYPDGFGGWVELYNPFPNQIERYSWREFLNSIGIPHGLFVKKTEEY